MVLLCKVFEQDHVVLFIGIVDKHCLCAHAQHLTDTQTQVTICLENQEAQCTVL